ncbi:leucine rich repeat [Holotrichia oblita]|uniref:Leucine rich repeat n=1 Tax=Holotrichia oblita TaxID=644536 RepID=A0ACB9TAE2_HOLOL|nr:leucine rich repeat [Holotrichia oblita]
MLYILVLILPFLTSANLFQALMKEGCEYDRETTSYVCVKITTQFPKMYFAEYRVKCVYCSIEVFTNETFPSKSGLRTFDVSGSKIHTITSKAFENLKYLEQLNLENNEISNITEDAFYGLRRVFELHLENNKIRTLTPGFLNEFEANVIQLKNNELVEIPNEVFKGLHGTLILDMSYNSISTLYPDSLKYLKGIEVLDLEGNDLCTFPVGVFKHIRGLRTLNLALNKFSSFPRGLFSPLTELMHLNISHNHLKTFRADMLLPLRIIRLDISGNSLKTLDVISVRENIPQLQWLVLNDNFWRCDDLETIVRYFTIKKVDVAYYSSDRYDVTNINGIACLEENVRVELKDIPSFLEAVKFATSTHKRCIAGVCGQSLNDFCHVDDNLPVERSPLDLRVPLQEQISEVQDISDGSTDELEPSDLQDGRNKILPYKEALAKAHGEEA